MRQFARLGYQFMMELSLCTGKHQNRTPANRLASIFACVHIWERSFLDFNSSDGFLQNIFSSKSIPLASDVVACVSLKRIAKVWSLKAWCCIQVTKSNKCVTIFSHLYSLSKLGNPTVLILPPDADDEDHQKQHIKYPFCWGENDQHTSCGMSWILLPTLRLQAGLHGNATGLFFSFFLPFFYYSKQTVIKRNALKKREVSVL